MYNIEDAVTAKSKKTIQQSNSMHGRVIININTYHLFIYSLSNTNMSISIQAHNKIYDLPMPNVGTFSVPFNRLTYAKRRDLLCTFQSTYLCQT